MNLDIASTLNFGDEGGLRHFFLDHYTVHLQTANALSVKYSAPFSTIGLMDVLSEDAWVGLTTGRLKQTTPALRDWLILHATIHDTTEQQIVSVGLYAPDLSVVDFSQPGQFYDWMYVHQEMHDYEQQALGLT